MLNISKDVSRKCLHLLLEQNIITTEQFSVISSQENTEENGFIHRLIDNNYSSEQIILGVLSKYYGIDCKIDINTHSIDKELLSLLNNNYILDNLIIPYNLESNTFIAVFIIDPTKVILKNNLESKLQQEVRFYLISMSDFSQLIFENQIIDNKSIGAKKRIEKLNKLEKLREKSTKRFNFNELEVEQDIKDINPVILFVDSLLEKAQKIGASDVHIEHYQSKARIRFRIDGLLSTQYEFYSFLKQNYQAIITRLKILAGCDISEKRLPQDGGLIFFNAKKQQIDMRFSSIPSKYGERVVMRITSNSGDFSISELNLYDDESTFIKAIEAPQGMVLVTGPTGSGKTTTLYSALRHINKESINILTVEDPVEHYLDGIGQVQVNEDINLSFSTVLRSFLRQDPEVILVGEIRDKPTLDVALKAAFTGHLVFSTLHTNDAVGTITRLLNMDVVPFMITASISIIIAQRLVRKNCQFCLIEDKLNQEIMRSIGFTQDELKTINLKTSKGCPKCSNTGFSGRQGVYEVLKIDKYLEEAILANKTESEIMKVALNNSFKTMQHRARYLLKQGVISFQECQRTLITDDRY